MRTPSLPSLAAALILCAATCVSQTPKEKEAAAPPTGLALEVNTKEGPIGHESVPGRSFGGRYRRLASWHAPAGAPQPRTFKMINDPEGGGVRVKVFAVMDRFHEQEVLLGDYLLREGEKAVVEAMRTYGYEPVEFTVVKVRPVPTLMPVATSKVPSVVVAGIEERPTNLPSYAVALRNLSHKDITYLEIHTYEGSRRLTVQWPRGEQNRPLVRAGETYEVKVSGAAPGARSPAGFTPSAPQGIEIVTALFADESYEGEPRSAVTYIAMLRGHRMQIVRALALLENAPAGADERAALEELERRVNALDRRAPADVEGLPAAIKGVTPQQYEGVRVFVEGGLDHVRKELLNDVGAYRRARERDPGGQSYNAWLGDLRRKYEAWLSRL